MTKSFARVPRRARAGAQLVEEQAPEPPVDRSPVVRIDQQLVPQLVALVQIGHPRRRAPQRQHPEGTAVGRGHHLGQEREERLPEARVRGDTPGRLEDVVLPRRIAVHPARVALGLAQRLLEVAVEPLAARSATRRRASGRRRAPRRRRARPSRRCSSSSARQRRRAGASRLGHARERADARAHVGAALRVVRRSRPAACAGSASAALAFAAWNAVDGEPEAARVAADLVQREQPDVAVERGVLDALRHHRARRLLEAHRRTRRGRAPRSEQHVGAAPSGSAGERAHGRRRSTRAAPRLDVGAVDRERRERALEIRRRRRAARSRSTSGANVVVACSSFASCGDARRTARRASPASSVERRLAGRIDEQRVGVVRGTRSRSSPRPASRAAARPARGSSRPRRARRPRRAAARGSRAGRRGRRGGRCAARRRGRPRTSSSTLRVRRLEHLRVLDAHAGELVDVEEAAVASRRGVEVEEPRAQRSSRQNGFSSHAAMWFGTMSSDDAEPARRPARASAASPPSSSETRVGSTTS